MSSKLHRVVFAIGCLVALPTWSASIFDNVAVTPNATWTGGAVDPSQTIFSWGDVDVGTNVKRTLTYNGDQDFLMTSLRFTGVMQNTYGASGEAAYITSQDTYAASLGFQLRLSNKATAVYENYMTTDFVTLDDPYTFDSTPLSVGSSNLNRTITNGTEFEFTFFGSSFTPNSVSLPDAVYNSLFLNVTGDEIAAQLTVDPQSVPAVTARAGTTATVPASTLVSNTGSRGTTLDVTAGAPVGTGFTGAATTFSLTKPDQDNPPTPSRTLTYDYTARSSLGGTTAETDSASVAITSDGADSPDNPKDVTLELQGTTVGPVFGLSGDGVSGPTGGTITFGNVRINKGGSAGPDTNALTVTNSFQDSGNLYGDTLTGLTVTGAPITGANADAFTGAPTNAVIADNNGTRDFNLIFAPTTGAAGGQAYTANVKLNTDVDAADGLGGTGAQYSYDLQGTAYLSTLSPATGAVDFGAVRIGAEVQTRELTATNITGGGYEVTGVTATTTSASTGAVITGDGSIGTITDGATGTRTYTFGAAQSLAPSTSAQALTAGVTISSTEAADVTRTLNATAVGPVFALSGTGVNGGTGGTIDFGNVLVTKGGGSAARDLTVTNRFTDPTNLYDNPLTGLSVTAAPITGTNPGAFSFSVAPPVGPIADNSGTAPLQITFNAAGAAGGQAYNAVAQFQTDVNAAALGNGLDYDYNLTGTAYLATLSPATGAVDFGAVRIGAGVQTRDLSATNITGGGYAITGVTATTTSADTGALITGDGSIGTIADGTTGIRTYSFGAAQSLDPSTSAQALTAGVTISSTEAADVTRTLNATAVGPVFALSGTGVTGATGGSIAFGNVLVTKAGGSVVRDLTVTNLFTDPTNLYDNALTGLSVNAAPITGTNPGAYSFSVAPPVGPIADNASTAPLQITFSATGAAGGQTYNAVARLQTDVNATALGDGRDYDYNLTGTAYRATLTPQATSADFGFVRIGGAAKTQTVEVQNSTGGGYAVNNISFSDTSVGSAFVGQGAQNIGNLADGAVGGRDYTVTAAGTLAPTTTSQTLTANLTVASNEAQDATPQLTAQAVGPVFDLSGKDVPFHYTNTTACGSSCTGGTINLGTLNSGAATRTLTIANLFGYQSGIEDVADLTLLNVGFWNGTDIVNSLTVTGSGDNQGLFTISNLGINTLAPVGAPSRTSAKDITITFSSSSGGPEAFDAPLYVLTDVHSLLGRDGSRFEFALQAQWNGTATPVPPSLALVGLGLAALGAARWRTRRA